MEISNYIDLKASNNIQLTKVGESFAVVANKYSPDTGERVSPIVEAIDRKQILELKAKLLAQIVQLDEILKDMETAEKII